MNTHTDPNTLSTANFLSAPSRRARNPKKTRSPTPPQPTTTTEMHSTRWHSLCHCYQSIHQGGSLSIVAVGLVDDCAARADKGNGCTQTLTPRPPTTARVGGLVVLNVRDISGGVISGFVCRSDAKAMWCPIGGGGIPHQQRLIISGIRAPSTHGW